MRNSFPLRSASPLVSISAVSDSVASLVSADVSSDVSAAAEDSVSGSVVPSGSPCVAVAEEGTSVVCSVPEGAVETVSVVSPDVQAASSATLPSSIRRQSRRERKRAFFCWVRIACVVPMGRFLSILPRCGYGSLAIFSLASARIFFIFSSHLREAEATLAVVEQSRGRSSSRRTRPENILLQVLEKSN